MNERDTIRDYKFENGDLYVQESKKSSSLRISPTIVQLHGFTKSMRYTYYGCISFLKTYEENGPTVEYLIPVRSKHNAIFLCTICSTTEFISKYQAV